MKPIMLAIAILGMLWCSAAQADAIFTSGNHPQPDEENILLKIGTTGSPVFGVTNISNTTVAFSSNMDTLTEPSTGQARVSAMDGRVNDITISVPGGTFEDLIINPVCPPGSGGCGTANVIAVANEPGGGTSNFHFSYDLGNGQNFLTITTSAGETLTSVTIEDPTGFDDLRQMRISGLAGDALVPEQASIVAPVPEPATVLLLGSGLIGIGAYARKRFKK